MEKKLILVRWRKPLNEKVKLNTRTVQVKVIRVLQMTGFLFNVGFMPNWGCVLVCKLKYGDCLWARLGLEKGISQDGTGA